MQNKKFIATLAAIGAAAAFSVVAVLGTVLGGNTQIKTNDDTDDMLL